MAHNDLTQGSVPTSLAKLTAPMVMGVSSSIVVQTLEMGFIGQLSTAHVAAITFTFPITMILTSLALGISIGTSSVIARSVGSGERQDVKRLATHSVILVTLFMVLLSSLAWLSMDQIFRTMGASESLLVLIHTYMDIYLLGTVLFTITMILGSVMRANGNAGIPGTIMTAGAAVNLIIDPILIFGWFGLPRMELAGAATAMLITRVLTTTVMLFYVLKLDQVARRFEWSKFISSSRRILHIGLPAMATQLIGPVTGVIITRMLAQHGETVVAGFGVATRIEAVAAMLMFALSGSIGPFVGQNWGGKAPDRVREGVRVSYQFCLLWGVVMALPLFLFGHYMASWIEPSEPVIAVAAIYLAIVPWSYGMWGVLMMASASFNALGKPLPSTVLSFTRMFLVYVPLAMLLNSLMGYQGIFVAVLMSNALMGVAGYLWFRQRLQHMTLAVKA
ncbi:MAG: MATE family efflux transporter [Pseudomonadota bacterium]